MDKRGRTHRSKKSVSKRQNPDDDSSYEDPSYNPGVKAIKKITQQPEIYEENDDILKGLEVDGNYVKVDENLIRRLKNSEVPPTEPVKDPSETLLEIFHNCPEYANMLSESKPVTKEFMEISSEHIAKNPWSKKMSEMIANLPLDFLALQRTDLKTRNFEYRYKPPIQPRVTNQYHSGRCWLFASLNALRYPMQLKFGLDSKFEFSAAYLFFFDKIERSNVFLEGVWNLRDKPLDDRYLQTVFTNPDSHMISDGGYWIYFKNLVQKYGLVPKTVYEDSYNCMVSDHMNDTLVAILNQFCLEIKDDRDISRQEFEKRKKKYLETVYDLIVKFMGEPPKKFNWQYKDAAENYYEINDLTPEKFFRVHVPHSFEEKMTFINDPRYPENYYKPYHVEYATNMIGGETVIFINLPLNVFKRAIAESQIAGEPVWFACDVTASLDFEDGTMSTERFNYKSVLGKDIRDTKENMMWMKTSGPSHAMVINGVDMDEPRDGTEVTYRKWRVENSWGINCEMEWHPDNGCWQMSDEWFDQYVFMATIDLKYFPEEEFQKIIANSKDKFIVRPWDVFGTVATHSGCASCHHKVPMRKQILSLSHK